MLRISVCTSSLQVLASCARFCSQNVFGPSSIFYFSFFCLLLFHLQLSCSSGTLSSTVTWCCSTVLLVRTTLRLWCCSSSSSSCSSCHSCCCPSCSSSTGLVLCSSVLLLYVEHLAAPSSSSVAFLGSLTRLSSQIHVHILVFLESLLLSPPPPPPSPPRSTTRPGGVSHRSRSFPVLSTGLVLVLLMPVFLSVVEKRPLPFPTHGQPPLLPVVDQTCPCSSSLLPVPWCEEARRGAARVHNVPSLGNAKEPASQKRLQLSPALSGSLRLSPALSGSRALPLSGSAAAPDLPPADAPPPDPPDRPKFRPFFPSPAANFIIFFSLGVFSWNCGHDSRP